MANPNSFGWKTVYYSLLLYREIQILDLLKLLNIAQKAALEAGKEILKVYNQKKITTKVKSDNSPVTEADEKAHDIIFEQLSETNIPILSEEGDSIPYKIRKDLAYLWVVDPLDGTKEFIKRNDEFTVNIALIHNDKPILGVVYLPVGDELYYAIKEKGAFKQLKDDKRTSLKCQINNKNHRIVTSRSHSNKETQALLDQYHNSTIIKKGSSIKLILIAEGKADIYPKLGPTMEWDIAAAQIILEEAGGTVLEYKTKKPLSYNKENLRNPFFIASNDTVLKIRQTNVKNIHS